MPTFVFRESVMLFRLLFRENALSPMDVTELGMVTAVRLECLNASLPIDVTGKP